MTKATTLPMTPNEGPRKSMSQATPANGTTETKPLTAPTSGDYGADQIKILEGLEAVRKRPGMYIGDTGPGGLHHLVYEAVDNSIDECMAGRATKVEVVVHADGSVSVADDGSGIPVEPKKHENPLYDGKPAIELVMTLLHAGGKFGEEGSAYKVSGGLHGVGISCVNALSEWVEVEVMRGGKIHAIGFERGKTTEPLKVIGDVPASLVRKTGTKVTFKPDPEIFPDTTFSSTTLSHRLRELAYLNPGVTIHLLDERVGADGKMRDETFRFENGLVEFVEYLNHSKQTLHEIVHLKGEESSNGFSIEIAMQYNDSYNELLLSFANNIRTVDGGTHLSGFKTALTRTINAYVKQSGLLKEKDPVPTGEDLREGLAAVVSVKLPEPQFEGQTKGKLRNTEVEGFVSQIAGERLAAWLAEHPGEAKKIAMKGLIAAQAREAARKARDLTRRKSALESGSMPAKLRDCTTRDVERSEMFIVEGDSAGGSATQGRDVETQAILPLRGKLLNVEKARLDKILGFEEIRTLISALKCGIGEDFDISKLRYGRVIIMTDADVDGSHIRTLLLTFFFRQMPQLIRRGKIYIAQPPLYLVERGKRSQYVLNESKMNDTLADLGLEGASLLVRDVNELDEQGKPRTLRTIEGEELRRLVKDLRRLAELVEVSERRGVKFVDTLAARRDGRLPTHRATWIGGAATGGGSAWAWSDAEVEETLAKHQLKRWTHELQAAAETGGPTATIDPRTVARVSELHENKELGLIFERLAKLGLSIEDYALVQEEAVTGELMPTKYAWSTPGKASAAAAKKTEAADDEFGESTESGSPSRADEAGTKLMESANIPSILGMLLSVGRRGMEIKRFKGLGEMDPAQLWETTMDPTRRTLLRVNWEDASAADELFTVLMGEDVEQRRQYIEEHALEVKSLDV
ncbi:MAG TPA: DNA topoisomerase (ATP-hydrolyzing) subunit B [Phycisphaerales bacterium]|nr:DNA topoisomerase (ATP-hydrolyzing) subunit B [Phycisphaerales bacterium]